MSNTSTKSATFTTFTHNDMHTLWEICEKVNRTYDLMARGNAIADVFAEYLKMSDKEDSLPKNDTLINVAASIFDYSRNAVPIMKNLREQLISLYENKFNFPTGGGSSE